MLPLAPDTNNLKPAVSPFLPSNPVISDSTETSDKTLPSADHMLRPHLRPLFPQLKDEAEWRGEDLSGFSRPGALSSKGPGGRGHHLSLDLGTWQASNSWLPGWTRSDPILS